MIPRGRYCNTPYLGTRNKVRKRENQIFLGKSHLDGTLHEPWRGPRTVQRSVQATPAMSQSPRSKAISTSLPTARGDLHDPLRVPWRGAFRPPSFIPKGLLNGCFNDPLRAPRPVKGSVVKTLGHPSTPCQGPAPRGSTRAVEGFTSRGAFRGGHALASQGSQAKAQLHETLNGPWRSTHWLLFSTPTF